MLQVAAVIRTALEDTIRSRLISDPNTRIRLVLVGPPREVLEATFSALTDQGADDWTMVVNDRQYDITVLWVDAAGEESTPGTTTKSQRCGWDYAVTIRNSVHHVVSLVTLSKVDSMQESITNATELMGAPQEISTIKRWTTVVPWPHILRAIDRNLGIGERTARLLVSEVMKSSADLEPVLRDLDPWLVSERLLEPMRPLEANKIVSATIGIPFSRETITEDLVRDGLEVIKRLGDFLGQQGLSEGVGLLKDTEIARKHTLTSALDDLHQHVVKNAGSGLAFSRAPTWHYRPSSPNAEWWQQLTRDHLHAMLEEVGAAKRPEKKKTLNLTCENALDGKKTGTADPVIVLDQVRLKARPPQGELMPAVSYCRTIGRSGLAMSASGDEGETCADDLLDLGARRVDKPIRYTCTADGYTTAKMDIVVLNRAVCRGTVRVKETGKNSIPTKPQKQPEWRQEILVSRSGVHDIDVYHASEVATVEIWHESKILENKPAANPARFILEDVEHGYRVSVILRTADKTEVSRWTVEFSVAEEDTGKAPTRFDALVQAHQQLKRRAGATHPRNVPLRQLEYAYLMSSDSWRPVVACWENEIDRFPTIDWSDPRLGTIRPQPDPRPVAPTIPQSLAIAREQVRQRLVDESRQLVEIDLAKPEFEPLLENYLGEYLAYLKTFPRESVWLDCIVIHAPEPNVQAGRTTATNEPFAVLLSPLHPLRLAWQVLAQSQLAQSLSNPCPAAGLLYPHGCPSIGLWTLHPGTGNESKRAFFAISSDNPYWAVLLNRRYLEHTGQQRVRQSLAELGIEPHGLVGRFTESQAENTMNEVAKILSGRSILRIGIVGSGEMTSDCIEGITAWCDHQFGEDSDGEKGGSASLPPRFVEVYYQKPASAEAESRYGLSSERIAALSEKSGERVKWFVQAEGQSRPHDLVVVDQLGIQDAQGTSGEAKSPLSDGVLYRSRVREDSEGALWLSEARIGKARRPSAGLPGLVEETVLCFEEAAVSDEGISQLRFRPNQRAIGERLEQRSRFVAVTSSQVDPACFSRGAEAQHGFIWDYEVPGALGVEEASAGYYLITRSSLAMKVAISKAVNLITQQTIDVEGMLNEVSRRGIPILKRMAAGGSASRGELGLLLAVRLLQDAFRGEGCKVRLPVWSGDCGHLILPVDPYETPLTLLGRHLRQSESIRYADLIVFSIYAPEAERAPVVLRITPLEVKFRENQMSPSDLAEALEQAASLGKVLTQLWAAPHQEVLWETCSLALLAQFVEYAFRIYADERIHGLPPARWTAKQERVLQAILTGAAQVEVNSAGRLLVFDGSASSEAVDMDNDGACDTAIVCRIDAADLLVGSGQLSPNAEASMVSLGFTLAVCEDGQVGLDAKQGDSSTSAGAAGQSQEGLPSDDTSPFTFDPVVRPGLLDREVTPSDETVGEEPDEGDRPGALAEHERQVIPPEIRGQVDQAFEGFIGNQRAVATLKRSLLKALVEKPPHLDKNFLLVGYPSTGKTELSKRMALALGLPFIHIDGRVIRTREKLFELIDAALAEQHQAPKRAGSRSGMPLFDYPAFVVFIDEVHLVPRKTQESLLTLLERSDRTVALEGTTRRFAQVTRGTFLFATTRSSELDKPFRSRCLEVPLQTYTRTEVAEIVHRAQPRWPRDVLFKIATYSRLVPRRALSLAQELKDEMLVSTDTSRSVNDHLESVARSMGIGELGLQEDDIRYLELLDKVKRPLGESAILSMLGTVDKDTILDEVEPYLAYHLDFVRMDRQGRVLTDQGRNFLLERRRRRQVVGESQP